MADEDESSKTEEPTDRKLSKARKKGNVATSQEVKNWAVFLGVALSMMLFIPNVMSEVKGLARQFIESPHAIPFDFESIRFLLANIWLELAIILAPLIGLLVFIAIGSNVGQVGLMWATEKIKPDLSKFNVIKGAKKLMSIQAIAEFIKGMFKLVIVSVIGFGIAVPALDDLALFPSMDLVFSLDRLYFLAFQLVVGVVAVLTVVAVLDFYWQKYRFTKSMKMTKQEVKDEHKSTEGDPQIKARIRKIRVERFQQRMMASVPQADVVITNPTHYAIALKYKMEEMQAPKLVAKGVDHLALRIREIADENNVTIVENPPLARALYAAVEVDEEIPAEHFKAVAEVIGYVMRLRGDLPPDPEADRAALSRSDD